MVLIMDVARFKYPPHWVPLSVLYKAMLDKDTSTDKSRGYLMLSLPTDLTVLKCVQDIIVDPVDVKIDSEFNQNSNNNSENNLSCSSSCAGTECCYSKKRTLDDDDDDDDDDGTNN